MPLNRLLIGKTYPPLTTEAKLGALQQYARAYNDDNPSYFDSSVGRIIAPPMFNVVATWLSLITVISDPELRVDLLRLLHRSQDMWFFTPIHPGDRISATASIVSIENSPAGEVMVIGLEAANQQQQLVSSSHFTALIRGRRRRDTPAPAISDGRPASPAEPLLTISQTIDPDQTLRYADASGDRNPIHLDDTVARLAGLPRMIVHGLCTMAFSSKVIIDQLCGRNPARLKRLAVSFSRPVFPSDRITTAVWRENDRDGLMCFGYETCNSAGAIVLRNGLAEIGPESRG